MLGPDFPGLFHEYLSLKVTPEVLAAVPSLTVTPVGIFFTFCPSDFVV